MCLVQLHERRLSGAYDIFFTLTCGLWVFKKFYYLSLSFYCKSNSKTELYPILLENIIKKYSGEMIIKTNDKICCDIILNKIKV